MAPTHNFILLVTTRLTSSVQSLSENLLKLTTQIKNSIYCTCKVNGRLLQLAGHHSIIVTQDVTHML